MPEVINPYIAGSPVTGTEMFFGRADVFEFVQQALTGKHRDNVIILYGQRRTGKTSVLYQMRRQLDPRYLPIFIDLHGLALEGLDGFLYELANMIVRTLRRDYVSALNGAELPRVRREDFRSDPRGYFENDFLNQVWSAIGSRHILLMLDEAIRLQEQVETGKLEKNVFEYLRHLMQHHERLNFLFALGSGLEELQKEYAFLFSVGLYKKISFLDRDSAVALITQPVKEFYTVVPNAVDRILQITSGHPYYIQLICHSLFNRWQRTRTPEILAADVEPVLDEVVERGLAVLKHVWDESTPGEKAILAGAVAVMNLGNRPVSMDAIAAAWSKHGVNLPADEKARAIKSLLARDILIGRDRYHFAVDLQRLWISRYERLEWVKEEIAPAIREWTPMPTPALKPAARTPVPQARAPAAVPRRAWLLGSAALALVLVPVLFFARELQAQQAQSVFKQTQVAVSIFEQTREAQLALQQTQTALNISQQTATAETGMEQTALAQTHAAQTQVSQLQTQTAVAELAAVQTRAAQTRTALEAAATQTHMALPPTPTATRQATATAVPSAAPTSIPGVENPTPSPTTFIGAGTKVVYSRYRQGCSVLEMLDVDSARISGFTWLASSEEPSWSPDGTHFVASSGSCEIQQSVLVIFNTNTGDRTPLSTNCDKNIDADWGNDNRIYFACGTKGANGDLFSINPDGSDLRALGITGRQPTLSPDREHLAFMRLSEGTRPEDQVWRIWVATVREDGTLTDFSQLAFPLVLGGVYARMPSWNSDGTRVLFNITDVSTQKAIALASVELATNTPRIQFISSTSPEPFARPACGRASICVANRPEGGLWLLEETDGLLTPRRQLTSSNEWGADIYP